MTAMTETDWQETAARMRREDKATTAEIAEAVGRSESQVRKVLAKANAERAINGAPSSNGDGSHDAIPGQTTVEGHLSEDTPWDGARAHEDGFRGDVPPEDDPEYEPPAREMDGGEPVEEPRLKGTQQLAIDFGPESEVPVGGTLKLRSDKLASGFYGVGDVITGTFEARVVDVLGSERLQRASGEFRMQPQGHTALITDITIR